MESSILLVSPNSTHATRWTSMSIPSWRLQGVRESEMKGERRKGEMEIYRERKSGERGGLHDIVVELLQYIYIYMHYSP